jgi:hypothetical protein
VAAGQAFSRRPLAAQNHNWFTEGFDTADLEDAKVLLECLSG